MSSCIKSDVKRRKLIAEKSFTYPGDHHYAGLFTYADVTAQARSRLPTVPRLVAELRAVLSADEPAVPMGAQCTQPYDCPFIDYCVTAEQGPPAEMPVAWLPGGRRAAAKLIEEGYRDIPAILAPVNKGGDLSNWHFSR